MSVFHVPEMHCAACVRALTAAVRGVDPTAVVRADLARRRVEVSAAAGDEAVAEAMREAGYDVEAEG